MTGKTIGKADVREGSLPRVAPSRAFARCSACRHATVLRAGASCLLCGGSTAPEAPPADLFTAWRCACYHCVSTPC